MHTMLSYKRHKEVPAGHAYNCKQLNKHPSNRTKASIQRDNCENLHEASHCLTKCRLIDMDWCCQTCFSLRWPTGITRKHLEDNKRSQSSPGGQFSLHKQIIRLRLYTRKSKANQNVIQTHYLSACYFVRIRKTDFLTTNYWHFECFASTISICMGENRPLEPEVCSPCFLIS